MIRLLLYLSPLASAIKGIKLSLRRWESSLITYTAYILGPSMISNSIGHRGEEF